MIELKTIGNKEFFQELNINFSEKLYLNHSLPNLQCNEIIDDNFEKGFVLYNENQIVAMACVINNPLLYYNSKKAICISHYECIEEVNLSKYLLENIVAYCKKLKFEYIIGPMNGSTWNNYRFATEKINETYTSEIYHKSYYAEFFENFGFNTASKYITNIDKCLKIPELESESFYNITFRNIKMENFEEEIKSIFVFSKNVFKNNFLFTDIEEKEFISKYLTLKKIILPELVIIAEENGELVGILFAINDFYSKTEKRLIVKTLARKNEPKYNGLGSLLSQKIMNIAENYDYKSVIHAFMEQDNQSKKVSNKFSGESYRSYKLYFKKI